MNRLIIYPDIPNRSENYVSILEGLRDQVETLGLKDKKIEIHNLREPGNDLYLLIKINVSELGDLIEAVKGKESLMRWYLHNVESE